MYGRKREGNGMGSPCQGPWLMAGGRTRFPLFQGHIHQIPPLHVLAEVFQFQRFGGDFRTVLYELQVGIGHLPFQRVEVGVQATDILLGALGTVGLGVLP